MDTKSLMMRFRSNGLASITERVIECNELTKRFGLTLSESQAGEIVSARNEALDDTARVELGEPIIAKVIFTFCDSPFIVQDNYVETVNQLLETFYYFKSDSLDILSDDELLTLMVKQFNGDCMGSIDKLNGALEEMCARLKRGEDIRE